MLASLQCERVCRTLNKRLELRRVLHETHPFSRSGCVVADWAAGRLSKTAQHEVVDSMSVRAVNR